MPVFTRRLPAHDFIYGLILALISSQASKADEGEFVLTHPDGRWSLHMLLPGYEIGPPKLFRDRKEVWVDARKPESGILITAFMEVMPEPRDSESCRKYYLKKLKSFGHDFVTYESSGMAIAEYLAPGEGVAKIDQKHFHAYLYGDGLCADIHFSRAHFQSDEERLFPSLLQTVRLAPATEQEIIQSKSYALSGGPAEEMLRAAAQKARGRDFTGTEVLLTPLCPWEPGKIPKRELHSSPACLLRVATIAESRGIRNGKTLALLYWTAADVAEKTGSLGAAEAIFSKSLDIDSTDPETWYSLGQLKRETNDLDGAMDSFNRALQLKPGDTNTMYWIATTLMDQRKPGDAEAILTKIQEADPKDARIWYRRGQIRMQQGRYQEAIGFFEKAKSLGVDAKMTEQKIRECKSAMSPN